MIYLYRFLCLLFFVTGPLASQEIEEHCEFYVSSISWHTAIIIPASTFPDSLWPSDYNFSDAGFLEIGWGEADYYPNDTFNIWYAFKSIFWPTSSVLHINPIHRRYRNIIMAPMW